MLSPWVGLPQQPQYGANCLEDCWRTAGLQYTLESQRKLFYYPQLISSGNWRPRRQRSKVVLLPAFYIVAISEGAAHIWVNLLTRKLRQSPTDTPRGQLDIKSLSFTLSFWLILICVVRLMKAYHHITLRSILQYSCNLCKTSCLYRLTI